MVVIGFKLGLVKTRVSTKNVNSTVSLFYFIFTPEENYLLKLIKNYVNQIFPLR